MRREALIFGATGAVDTELLKRCLSGDRYSEVTVIARQSATLEHEKLCWIEAELGTLDTLEPVLGAANGDAYCCLGTTMKAAGSPAAFKHVDFDLVLKAARYSKRSRVQQFCLVSAIGADPKSGVLYNRIKGQVEAAIIAEDIPVLRIFRPSLLKGERNEFRLGESLGNWVSFLLIPLFALGLRRYQPVAIPKLARALYQSADESVPRGATRIYESDEIQTY